MLGQPRHIAHLVISLLSTVRYKPVNCKGGMWNQSCATRMVQLHTYLTLTHYITADNSFIPHSDLKTVSHNYKNETITNFIRGTESLVDMHDSKHKER